VEIMYDRVAAIDVGKKVIAVAVRTPGERAGKRRQQVRKFNTYYRTLGEMVAWLVCEGVTHVSMEATGMYWRPCGCRIGHPYEVTWAYAGISPPSRSWHRRSRPGGDAAMIAGRGARVVASAGAR
jgi:hypothetical protein